jgi:short-subunit dehydrogenase
MHPLRTIAITGASAGLGASLAREYASSNVLLALAARRTQLLQQVEADCVERGARVSWARVDVRDVEQVEDWIAAIERVSPIDLLIANAGVFSGHGPDGRLEGGLGLTRQIETNLIGTIATANAAARRMKERGQGHIALVSSLAALMPLADAPAYSASKAGILAYGEALREYLASSNVTVSVILPGHIATAQTLVHAGPLPGILPVERAARIIRNRLERRETFIAFPHKLHWMIRLGRLLPWRARARANRPFRFHVTATENYAGET